MRQIHVLTLAELLGWIESRIAHRATITHVGMGAEARVKAGITDNLLRKSVSLAAEADLISDLERSLAALMKEVSIAVESCFQSLPGRQ